MNESDGDLIQLLAELVRTPSVMGGEEAVAQRVREAMEQLPFSRVEVDETGNVLGILETGADGPTLLLDAHMDTVDVVPREAWSRDPFGAERVGDRIYGRGTTDMKGPLAALLLGIRDLESEPLAGRLVVAASVGEETTEGTALEGIVARYRPDWVVICEPTDLRLVRAGRGRAELSIETRGAPAHASTPELGSHAVHAMISLISEIERLECPSHPFVGRGVLCLTDLISSPYPAQSVVPSGCRATYERRLVPGETRSEILGQFRECAQRAGYPETRIELSRVDYTTYTGARLSQQKWYPAWKTSADHPLVRKALTGLRKAGIEPRLGAYGFCTNAAYTAGVAGIPTVGFGPSRESMAHIVDEYIELDQLRKARLGYRQLIRVLLAG